MNTRNRATSRVPRGGSREPRSGSEPFAQRIVWDTRNRIWGGRYLAGGAPWGLIRCSQQAQTFIGRLHSAGASGLFPMTPTERVLAARLVARGVAHPVPPPRQDVDDVVVIVPAYGRAELLDACLRSLDTVSVVVVDDASPGPEVRRVAEAHGARVLRQRVNQGPAAARNAGLAATSEPLVAFLDSDCTVPSGWLHMLLAHFDDPRVGLIAPRVRPRQAGTSMLARHEDARSALDMGGHPELVGHGARLGFLPSAALIARRSALPGEGFDDAMRVGEDVDLVWRTIEAGWQARFDPAVVVHHEMRLHPWGWARRRFEYGTSAAMLDRRHPGRVAPARVSAWNVAIGLLATARQPIAAVGVAGAAVVGLGRALGRSEVPPVLAGRVVLKGFLADVAGLGHALRREWWPIGWLGLATAARSRWSATAVASMLAPVVLEYVRTRPALDPARYVVARLVEDAAYGTGVLVSVVRERRLRALLPEIRWPSVRRT